MELKFTLLALLTGFVIDCFVGDPANLPHPVMLIGRTISLFEKTLRRLFPKTARGEIARLNEIIAGRRVVFVKPQRKVEPVVTRFYRNGQLWEKTRVGNVATERLVEPRTEFHVVAGKYDGDEENCKFADVRETREDAEALLATVSDYPWSRIEERAAA